VLLVEETAVRAPRCERVLHFDKRRRVAAGPIGELTDESRASSFERVTAHVSHFFAVTDISICARGKASLETATVARAGRGSLK
jgi:hypothetical protein